ncbi:YheC/YheD family protein [Paenibacillus pinistramenti]|uniref:YheC/YheD family protein n=1 Tax=Paenibacillus pinistramenti TaxID=1768003 RepID=UPI001108E3EC|nr:YheC/YheD family protein [Paenibacillus pinistramenti]
MLIGVFHPQDPFAVTPPRRIQALCEEAGRQEVQLIFFNEEGIDLEHHTITGKVPSGEDWLDAQLPFPASVMNIRPWGPRKRSFKELVFRKKVPFTAFLIGDKWEMTRRLAHSPKVRDYLVPTVVLENLDIVDDFLDKYEKVVIKPASGSRGAGVQGLTRSGKRYLLQKDSEELHFDRKGLIEYLTKLKKSYLIQPYIRCLTPEGAPFDFRILVQRNGQGEWTVPVIYPRIGESGTITSNVSVGGRTELLEAFLARVLPEGRYSIPKQLHDLGLVIAEEVNSYYDFPINELGIDLAIDDQNRIWFYEANTCPGTLNHEEERAVQAVAYAKFVGSQTSGQKAKFPVKEDKPLCVGLLFPQLPDNTVLGPFAAAALESNIHLAAIAYDDLDVHAGHAANSLVFDGKEWRQTAQAVPDLIYNLIEPEDGIDDQELYNTYHQLRLTSGEPKGQLPASLFLALMATDEELHAAAPSYVIPQSAADAVNFLNANESVVMKAGSYSELEETIMIRGQAGHYEVIESSYTHRFDKREMEEFFKLFKRANYCLIRQTGSTITGGHPVHIRAYLMKDGESSWKIMHIAPLLALAPYELQNNHPVEVDWEWLLDREFGPVGAAEAGLKVQKLAARTAEVIEAANYKRIHELIVDFGLDREQRFWLLGAQIGGCLNVVHPYETARTALSYAAALTER